jgi:hypothetical protein
MDHQTLLTLQSINPDRTLDPLEDQTIIGASTLNTHELPHNNLHPSHPSSSKISHYILDDDVIISISFPGCTGAIDGTL